MSVAVIMGSDSDLPTMQGAIDVLRKFEVAHEVRCISAHRDPHGMISFASDAVENGFEVIIAGAGGAAHLPGMVASATILPVIGVPVGRPVFEGLDALLSIVQMPAGIPVATMAVDGSENAGLLAVRILALNSESLRQKLHRHTELLRTAVETKNEAVSAVWP